MVAPLILWGLASAGGMVARWLLTKSAESTVSKADDQLAEARHIEYRIQSARDTMQQRCQAFLLSKQHVLEEKLRSPILPYQNVLSSLKDIQPPPALAAELNKLPNFSFDYSRPTVDFSSISPSVKSGNYLATKAMLNGQYNQGSAYSGLAWAADGMEKQMKASEYRAQTRNFHEEVKRAEKTITEALASDEAILKKTVEALFSWMEQSYFTVQAVSNSQKPWDALTSLEQLTLRNYFYPIAKFGTLCGLPAFRLSKE